MWGIMKEIRFLSFNQKKIDEVTAIMAASSIKVIPTKQRIAEIQSDDVNALLRDKCMKAYKIAGRPIFVEHTGLEISYLNQFPKGLTQLFWDTLEADKIADLIGKQKDNKVTAITNIGYCDGKKIHFFSGAVSGIIPPAPKGPREFQWDCVFQPDGYSKTFAEMDATEKNKISMRMLALRAFRKYLETC